MVGGPRVPDVAVVVIDDRFAFPDHEDGVLVRPLGLQQFYDVVARLDGIRRELPLDLFAGGAGRRRVAGEHFRTQSPAFAGPQRLAPFLPAQTVYAEASKPGAAIRRTSVKRASGVGRRETLPRHLFVPIFVGELIEGLLRCPTRPRYGTTAW